MPDVQPVEGISVILSSSLVSTKAAKGDEGNEYTYATSTELQVNQVHLAFFDESGTLLSGKDYAPVKSATSTDTLAYKVTNITVYADGNVRVLAIANSNADYSECKKYADYETVIENNGSAEFNPSNLVKVGELPATTISNGQTLEIPMVQLASKVVLDLTTDLPVYSTKEESRHSIDGFLDQLDKRMNRTSSNKPCEIKDKQGNTLGYAYKCDESVSFKYGGLTIEPGGYKIAHITGITVDSIFTTSRSVLDISSLTVTNVETQSPILVPDGKKRSLGKLPMGEIGDIAGQRRIVFYTYQKQRYASDQEAGVLTVKIGGDIQDKDEVITKSYTGATAHGVWTLNGKVVNGWNEGGDGYKFVYLQDIVSSENLKPVGEPDYVTMSGKSSPANYEIKINPKYVENVCTDGFVRGNLYHIKATVKKAKVDWVITKEPWREKSVNGHFGGGWTK